MLASLACHYSGSLDWSLCPRSCGQSENLPSPCVRATPPGEPEDLNQIPDDTVEPWHGSCFTKAGRGDPMCSLALYPNNPHPPRDSSPLPPAFKVAAALSGIMRDCKHGSSEQSLSRRRALIIAECQGCPPHFSGKQTHFFCCVTPPPLHHRRRRHHFSKPTHKHTSYAASLKCIPLFLKWGGECCCTQNGHWHISWNNTDPPTSSPLKGI